MRNIWEDGFEIERDGQKIALTKAEITEIYKLFDAENGHVSLEWWLDSCREDESEERIKAVKEMMEDEIMCYDVWQRLCDNDEIDLYAVEYMIDDYINNKGDNE